MRKNYIYLFFLFLFTTILFAQKVTITPTSVNGSNVSAGPINLASVPYSTISLGVKVEIPAGAAVGDQGTLKVYYMNSVALGANVANGGDGGTLYFGGGKTATKSFTINLNWADFQTSGGFVYAEYKSSNSPSSTAYKSAYLSVIKNATMTTGTNLNPPADAPNPTKIPNTLCCNQTVRLGEKPAIITGTPFLNPYQGEPYGINTTWIAAGLSDGVRFINNTDSTLEIDHLTEIGKLTVTRGLGYRYGGQYPNKSNAITITVVPSPIINNISVDGYKDVNGFVEITNTNPKPIYSSSRSGAQVNLNILQDPYHISQRGDIFADIEKYEWQYSKTNQNDNVTTTKNWTTLPNEYGATLEYFIPENLSSTDDNYYVVRRIAFYKDIRSISNNLKIIPRIVKNNNIICCDQVLGENSISKEIGKPSIITGTIPSIENLNLEGKIFQLFSISYQWQSQAININRANEYGIWTNITDATSKDYLPPPLQFVTNPRGSLIIETTYNYRRIATINYQITSLINGSYTNNISKSYSNEVKVRFEKTYEPPTLIAYPNPASSIINVEYKGADYILSNTRITVANTLGTIVNSNIFSSISPNIISIDVSNFPIGTYFINIETGLGARKDGKITFLKKN